MCDFAPGDGVTPLQDAWDDADRRPWQFWKPRRRKALSVGAVYVVSEVCFGRIGTVEMEPQPLHRLQGVDLWFCQSRFRKVRRRDLTVWLATDNTIEEPKRAPVGEPA